MGRFLLEPEAKARLAAAGIEVPRSWGAEGPPSDAPGPFVAKVLVRQGRRGVRGGVLRVEARADLGAATQRLLTRWRGEDPLGVHVEECVDRVEREVYLGVAIDRTRRLPCLLVARGGVAVEDESASRIWLSPVRLWQPYVRRRLCEVAGLSGRAADAVGHVAERLVRVFAEERADSVEINPLAVRDDGTAVALDAKIVVPGDDDRSDAAGEVDGDAPLMPDALEERCRLLGVNAVGGHGDVAVVTSGAGLLLATVDLLGDRGARLGPMVDLGATVFGDAAHVATVMRLVLAARPRQVLVNYFVQFASCRQLAERLLESLPTTAAPRVVVRQRGVDADAARALLEASGCHVTSDLERACDLVLATPAGR